MKTDKKRRKSEPTANQTILKRTLFLMLMCGVVAFIPLFVRLYNLQIVQHDELQAKALNQQTWDQAVTANRGTIYDSKGATPGHERGGLLHPTLAQGDPGTAEGVPGEGGEGRRRDRPG